MIPISSIPIHSCILHAFQNIPLFDTNIIPIILSYYVIEIPYPSRGVPAAFIDLKTYDESEFLLLPSETTNKSSEIIKREQKLARIAQKFQRNQRKN
jgi:hypothetical protein